ncbi:hypothetical protein AiwAL_19200 [Acidiphilium sp. AL]|uniref:Uncharacterized protein n=1 Tax=Acidiphilium iwatense TaxID=768198 RepID=A0ABS9E186_9PROT|nr:MULTISPECIES: hypothetical protein [Acidiphilium]MCF3948766.1 hypothetical protein [Acidiphilium iwatense]MCU4162179.1 hypothetical protein [Acidiphilium sp. AL]
MKVIKETALKSRIRAITPQPVVCSPWLTMTMGRSLLDRYEIGLEATESSVN